MGASGIERGPYHHERCKTQSLMRKIHKTPTQYSQEERLIYS